MSAPARANVRPAAPGRLPDFFIVGHPKSGTTALYEMLRSQPEIYMAEEKEPWFFSIELRERAPPRKPIGIPETLEDYLALFTDARPQQLVGEASTTYLWSPTAAERIAQVQPDARIVAILREPAGFLRSLHLQFVESFIESEDDFGKALSLESERRAGRRLHDHTYWPQMLIYSEHVHYVEQLRRYHGVFPAEQVLVLLYDDFRADNERTVRTVLDFLGVRNGGTIELTEANPSVAPRSQRLHQLVHTFAVGHGPASRAVKRSLKAMTPDRQRRRALESLRRRVIYAPPPPVDEQLMSELRRRYRGEVLALSEYLGRDLVELWGYEQA